MPRSRDEDDDYDKDEEEMERPRARRRPGADDDADEAPRARKRPAARDEDDDEDERPRARKRAARDEDDDDEPAPTRKRRAARDDDDDEDEKPVARKRRTVKDDDDDEPAPRKRRAARDDEDDDDDDERPRRSTKPVLEGGWGPARKVQAEGASYASTFKPTGDDQVVKFLDDEPYVSFKQHWITREGKRSFTCLQGLDPKGCPLCAIGDKPSSKFCFNIAAATSGKRGTTWTNYSLDVGVTVLEQLGNFNEDARNGPLTKAYWAVRRSGKNQKSTWNWTPIKADNLGEDWDLDEPDKAELKALKAGAYSATDADVSSRSQLKEIADEQGS